MVKIGYRSLRVSQMRIEARIRITFFCFLGSRMEYECSSIDYFPNEEYSPDPSDSTMAIPCEYQWDTDRVYGTCAFEGGWLGVLCPALNSSVTRSVKYSAGKCFQPGGCSIHDKLDPTICPSRFSPVLRNLVLLLPSFAEPWERTIRNFRTSFLFFNVYSYINHFLRGFSL